MWIVRLALRRPYTFIVMALLIAILGGMAILTTPTDVFPYINIPVAGVIWSYSGMSPDDMAKRVLLISERAMTTTVNSIQHIESTAYNGVGLIRVYLQPGANTDLAISQIVAVNQTILRTLPPGIFPPLVVQYDASSVPILQLGLSSNTLTEQELYDYGQNFIRTRLSTVPGISVPLPYGGKVRGVMVDLNPGALFGKGLSATDVSNALNLQNLILPTGTVKVGTREYLIQLNSSPELISALDNVPIKTVNGAPIYMRDVAQVRDGYQVQTNIVRTDGKRSALLTVLRHGGASTLEVVDGVKKLLPAVEATLPPALRISPLFDQSIFVRASVSGVVREATIAAVLTGLMILLFLGSWRSTLIVCLSIPLSILTSLIVLSLLGQTINVMTLGGLALAVGILVDDATVEIENVHRNMGMKGKSLVRAILDGAQQIAVPAFVSTLCICIVFVPVLMLSGAAKYLFTPLAMAVVFAMLTSYLLTRTVVPTLVHYLLPVEIPLYQEGDEASSAAKAAGPIWRIHQAFDRYFEKLRDAYHGFLEWVLENRAAVGGAFAIFAFSSLGLVLFVGRDFFPYVDSGQMRLHVRCPSGTRIEEAERIFGAVEEEIRRVVPPQELDTILDNIGLPNSGINLAFSDSATSGSGDGEILVSLKPTHHPTIDYTRQLRSTLAERFPSETFFFQAADITSQILNFGLPAPIDVQVTGNDATGNYQIATQLRDQIARLPGAVDTFIRQQVDYPTVKVNVDRIKADESGLTQRDVADSLLISLSSSGQVAPNQWLNPQNGVNYNVAVQTPQFAVPTFDAMQRTPITALAGGRTTQLLDNLASLQRTTSAEIESHYDVQPVIDVYASPDRRDLGGFAVDVNRIIDKVRQSLPPGTTIELRGQVDTMQSSFTRLGLGMVFAILLVYLLMAVNFQSWLDPFIILTALPGAMAGMLWMLYLTRTTLSVPALMGAIMGIGVATANSILLVTFANDEREQGKNAMEAALSAGFTRIRPVIMTALAMIIGMVPMALGMGDGGEQNAPLGRAVIGNLLLATPTTLFFVPIMYSWLRKKAPVNLDAQIATEAGETTAGPGGKD
ncbi:MAG TPA: efflux RND transporter permease subunit [Bryobacteraceae bacterium]|nr:efflux RND transporter permease subunit [Bryobacteraceae bacterium]HXR15491.1 efflux RND transporter permease subunit [Terriglobales bacterium]